MASIRDLIEIQMTDDDLSKAGWTVGWVSTINSNGQTIWIVDAHRDDGKRFVVRAERRVWNLNLRSALAANCVDN